MKRLIFILLTIGAIIVFLYDNSQAQSKRSFDYKNFTGIDAGWSAAVSIEQADNYGIDIEGAEADLTELKVIKKGKTLVFYFENPDYTPHNELTISIKMPELYNVTLHRGSSCNVFMNIESDDFKASLSGGSTLTGKLNCEDIEINSSGKSSVVLDGKAETLTIKESEESALNLKDFYVEDVNADLSENSTLIITAYGTISANQVDGSGIIYYGNPVISQTNTTGGSTIAKGE